MSEKGSVRAVDASWKEKYLESLEAIEQIEARSGNQVDLLKRCMVRVSLAADGIDPDLDATMGMLRDSMRQELSTQQLESVANQVEACVLELDKRKATNSDELLTQFDVLINQLIALSPPRKIKSQLKSFRKKLEPLLDSTYLKGVTLAEYVTLQGEALEKALPAEDKVESPSFFKKLFSAEQEHAVEPHTEVPQQDNDDRDSFRLEGDSLTQEGSANEEIGLGEADVTLTPNESDAIRERMGGIFLTMLDLLHIPASWQQEEDLIRNKIARGIYWSEVPDTLSELVGLVNDSANQLQKDTELFLQSLNMRLCDIQNFLVKNQELTEEKEASSERLGDVVKSHIEDISRRLSSGANIGELKGSIEEQLDKIVFEIDIYKKQEQTIDEDTLESVKALTTRIESLEKEARIIRDSYVETKEQAYRDSLTKLPNRLSYDKRSLQEYSRWHRYRNPLSIAVCDLDLFKRINDSYGHTAGDKVLKKVSETFLKCLRSTDFICRYGGEEFVILLPETELESAKLAMEKLRKTVEESPFHFRGERVVITVSIGVAQFCEGNSLEQVFERADKAVYRAKEQGRNQVVLGNL